MKTKDEIIEKIKIFKQIKEKSPIFSSEFTLACGSIQALEWVVKEQTDER